MSTLSLTHEAISKALSDDAPLSPDQRAALIGLVARDKRAQAEEDARLAAEHAAKLAGAASQHSDSHCAFCEDTGKLRDTEGLVWDCPQGCPITPTGIYVASRASTPERSQMWRDLRAAGWYITSSWIDEAGPGQTANFTELWSRIEGEIRGSQGLIIYAEPEDFPLKGAYIEAGIALGAGLPVAVVMPGVELEPRSCRPMGSWIQHPKVTVCATLEDARAHIEGRRAVPAAELRDVNTALLAETDRLRRCIKSVWAKASAAAERRGFTLVDQGAHTERYELVPAPGAAGPYTVERHGSGWAIYSGRDQFHHGFNLGQLSECDESIAKRVEAALNAAGVPGLLNPVRVTLTAEQFYDALRREHNVSFSTSNGGFVVSSHPELGAYPDSYRLAVMALARSAGLQLSDDHGQDLRRIQAR